MESRSSHSNFFRNQQYQAVVSVVTYRRNLQKGLQDHFHTSSIHLPLFFFFRLLLLLILLLVRLASLDYLALSHRLLKESVPYFQLRTLAVIRL